MVMIDPDKSERAHLAAEYALGTLDDHERAVAETLVITDAAFALEVENWRKRFDALWDVVPSFEPPSYVLGRILDIINREDFDAEESENIVKLRRTVRIWKAATAGAMALAASLLLFIGIRGQEPPAQTQFVAILESTDRTPAFVAAIDVKKSSIAIRRLATEPSPGHSYELWAISGQAKPQSLGLVDNSTGFAADRLRKASSNEQLSGVILAVTLEPKGGSPTGQPTTTPIFTGKLVQAPLR